MSNKCEKCDFFLPLPKSLVNGHCIYQELNKRRVVIKQINEKCKYYKPKGSLSQEIKKEYFIRYDELKKEWRIAKLKKEWRSLSSELDRLIEEEEETEDMRKKVEKYLDRIEKIENEIKDLGGVIFDL